MRILHIANSDDISELFKESLIKETDYYESISFIESKMHKRDIMKYDLLIIEAKCEQAQCDYIIDYIGEAQETHVYVIIISEEIDFENRKKLYDKSVMAIVEKQELEIMKFKKYIDSIEMELRTIKSLKEMRIAVVDDSKFSLKIIKDYFEKYEIVNVDYFQDSEKLLNTEFDYDVFIVDLVMPVYGGEDIIYKIREINESGIIILITEYSDIKAISYCLSIGADDFILKPLDFKLFVVRLNSCIKKYKLKIENEKSSKLLYDLATKDALTGIYNRTFFMESFAAKLESARRNEEMFSVILFDIDHFKLINDDYGHQKGDAVLKSIAKAISTKIRKTDIFCRWGGEEFVVLLPKANIEVAKSIAEKLRIEIENLEIEGVRQITCSFGVTNFIVSDTEDSIFKRVDNSLYLAKLTGRNKVISDEQINIDRGGVPINIGWGPFFKSGNEQIDEEHRILINLCNEIIVNCFIENKKKEVIVLFKKLLDHIVFHFANEEQILKVNNYKDFEIHKKIHKELVEKSINLYNILIQDKTEPVKVVKYIVQDVIVGHIIKADFEFYDIFKK